ncbi:MAG TPA: SAM-dependent methyltransferase [Bryobacteraceae bacterium]|jgi:SAM-dependent methyltransferase
MPARPLPKTNPPIERGKRLSRSILWKWQREFFEKQGIEAWRGSIVPHHITNSPFIADAYAQILGGFLCDCARETDRPVRIVELGSGSGRLAYLIVKNLLKHFDSRAFQYVMTDISKRTIEFWRSHAYFRPMIEMGVLEMAHFDPERDAEIHLRSGEKVGGPLAVVANYVFDGIPQDAFHARDGRLFEGLVTLRCGQPKLATADLSYHYRPARENYYSDAEWNEILQDYTRRLPDTKFLFPVSALQTIDKIERISAGRYALLSADRGYSGDAGLALGNGAPIMTYHGSISMMVDYQILGEFVRRRGGEVLHPDRPTESINVSAFLQGRGAGRYRETRRAYEHAIQEFGPDDFFTLKEGVEGLCESLTLETLVALLRLSRWDYRRFLAMAPRLSQLAADSSPEWKREIAAAALRVWDAYLPLGEAEDVAFAIGTVVLQAGYYAEALDFFGRSAAGSSHGPEQAHYTGLCHLGLGQVDEALECFERALEFNPAFEPAKRMRQSALQHQRRRRGNRRRPAPRPAIDKRV